MDNQPSDLLHARKANVLPRLAAVRRVEEAVPYAGRWRPAPVPTQKTSGLDQETPMSPIEPVGALSKIGYYVRP